MELLHPRPSRDPPPKLDVVLPNSEGWGCLAVSLLQLWDVGLRSSRIQARKVQKVGKGWCPPRAAGGLPPAPADPVILFL